MSTQGYRVVPVSLALAAQRRRALEQGPRVQSLTVLGLPAGAVFNVHLGSNDAIPVTVEGITFESDDPCQPLTNEGVFVTFPAQPGVTVTLLVSFGSARTAPASA